MSQVVNPVFPGLLWSQEFLLNPTLTPAGSFIVASLWARGKPRESAIEVTLLHPTPGQHILTLTEAQTTSFSSTRAIMGDFFLHIPGEQPRAIFRAKMPVTRVATGGAA